MKIHVMPALFRHHSPPCKTLMLAPGMVVAICCVANKGVSAVVVSPLLFLLPIAQGMVVLVRFVISFDLAVLFSAMIWVGLVSGMDRMAARIPPKIVACMAAAIGVLYSAAILWSLRVFEQGITV